jgi:hypothetical protein
MGLGLAALGLGLALGSSAGIVRAEKEPDAVSKAWRARAELAGRKLASGKLDACDRAVEEAFAAAREDNTGKVRSFAMPLKLGGEAALVTYFYSGQTLESFTLGLMPKKWLIMQRATSKTVSIAPIGGDCALDLCTNNPTVDGPCPDDRPR